MRGRVLGIRFFKGASNTGSHVGNLWANDGSPLANVTFVNETASGWQYQAFANPVFIEANTTYVASYHTNVGYYSATGAYFAAGGVVQDALTALGNGESGGNGLYRYGPSGFPSQSFNATNYWVDIVFEPQP